MVILCHRFNVLASRANLMCSMHALMLVRTGAAQDCSTVGLKSSLSSQLDSNLNHLYLLWNRLHVGRIGQ
jgi:hypothetical protein